MSIPSSPSANLILSTFRSKGVDQRIGPLKFSDSSQARVLESLSREIASGRSECSRVLFTTGLGLSDSSEVPDRLPAIMVPALHAMERQQQLGLTPAKYLVYQATDFIVDTNGIEASTATNVSTRMEQFLHRYVQEVHPSLEDRVEFRFERNENVDSSASIELLIRELSKEVSSSMYEKLCMNESVHSHRNGQAMRYAAANVLYSGASPEDYPFTQSLSGADIIVPIGGRPEKPFFQLTNAIAEKRGANVIPMITHIGAKPTYYPVPEGRLTQSDFRALEADGAPRKLLQKLNPVVL